MLIIIGISVHYGLDAIDKATLEDIKTNMISIKTRAKIIADEYNYGDIDSLKGVTTQSSVLQSLGLEGENYYTWDKATLTEQGLSNIEENAYIVHYNLENPNECEVYYIDGFEN